MTASPPDVSVVIPTRNRVQYLRQAIDSALAQRHVRHELIIVNDGEADLPPHPDPRVIMVDNAQRGAVAARNLGVASASGQHIAFLDDDDWWVDASHLALSLGAKAQFTFTDGEFIFMDGSVPVEFAQEASAQTLRLDNTILISGVCYAKILHDELGNFDDALPYYWDWDWYLRVAGCGTALIRIASPSVCIRVHEGNMSGEKQENERRANLDRLARKHGIGPLRLKNHLDIARGLISSS